MQDELKWQRPEAETRVGRPLHCVALAVGKRENCRKYSKEDTRICMIIIEFKKFSEFNKEQEL